MRARGSGTLGAGLAALFLLPSCAGGGTASEAACATPAAAQAAMTAQATAKALAGSCPGRGVWSLLANLSIASYASGGKLIFHGAESGPHGLFVYDFEVPVLARMASQRVGSFSSFAARLKAIGLNKQPADLLAIYKTAYQSHPTAFLPQLFAQMKLAFDGDPQLTALQQWVLVVDALVPPPAAAAAANTVYAFSDTPVETWGLSYITADTAGISIDRYDLPHVLILSDRFKLTINPGFVSASTGVKKLGDKVALTVSVGLEPQGAISFGNPYGPGASGPHLAGPLENVPVTWSLTGGVDRLGRLQLPGGNDYSGEPTWTDVAGATHITYQAGEDPGQGLGPAHEAGGMVVGTPDLTYLETIARTNYDLVGAFIVAVSVFVPPAIAVMTVRYHGASYKLTITAHSSGGGPPPTTSTITGTVALDPAGAFLSGPGTLVSEIYVNSDLGCPGTWKDAGPKTLPVELRAVDKGDGSFEVQVNFENFGAGGTGTFVAIGTFPAGGGVGSGTLTTTDDCSGDNGPVTLTTVSTFTIQANPEPS